MMTTGRVLVPERGQQEAVRRGEERCLPLRLDIAVEGDARIGARGRGDFLLQRALSRDVEPHGRVGGQPAHRLEHDAHALLDRQPGGKDEPHRLTGTALAMPSSTHAGSGCRSAPRACRRRSAPPPMLVDEELRGAAEEVDVARGADVPFAVGAAGNSRPEQSFSPSSASSRAGRSGGSRAPCGRPRGRHAAPPARSRRRSRRSDGCAGRRASPSSRMALKRARRVAVPAVLQVPAQLVEPARLAPLPRPVDVLGEEADHLDAVPLLHGVGHHRRPAGGDDGHPVVARRSSSAR